MTQEEQQDQQQKQDQLYLIESKMNNLYNQLKLNKERFDLGIIDDENFDKNKIMLLNLYKEFEAEYINISK